MGNVGTADRIVRLVLGGLLLIVGLVRPAWASGVLATVLAVVGLVLLLTGIFGLCPLYRLFGINTKGRG